MRRGLPLAVAEHLSHNYGDKAGQLAALVEARPRLAAPLATGFPFIEAEVVYAIKHEYAVTAVDVLARRTRLAFLHKEVW
jgi:glycerol-3-phosphate dehydrogenase